MGYGLPDQQWQPRRLAILLCETTTSLTQAKTDISIRMSSLIPSQLRSNRRRLQQDLALVQSQGKTQGITLEPIPDTDLQKWTATIDFRGPEFAGSPYEGGVFEFTLNMSGTEKPYPLRGPEIFCNTKIYNPHVDQKTGEVGFSMLSEDQWSPILTLFTTMLSLLVALGEPEPGYEVDGVLMLEYISDPDVFWEKAREWTRKYAVPGNTDTTHSSTSQAEAHV
ncbi:Ubiquitin-conjugating enzyme E2 1 [Cercospora beticola]|uniref:Ubiquitin-conjugating enzyme E2 1 n=1 Tax=Cercospora beticola TaxID=122368 RepID=A0A2G5IB59_CERBT|nr:Ubiquitin-conjugating enzyme E2 1 [Cercospora beticola]PIB02096.1 Ubiquitin-conjugating enzyme E2 1 [Cercospora beticola]WPA97001.1 hypothetical protein RHO25_001609 [Cercospora beticola]CAK1354605.1 unnamed protein product [Cercospora beticola]